MKRRADLRLAAELEGELYAAAKAELAAERRKVMAGSESYLADVINGEGSVQRYPGLRKRA